MFRICSKHFKNWFKETKISWDDNTFSEQLNALSSHTSIMSILLILTSQLHRTCISLSVRVTSALSQDSHQCNNIESFMTLCNSANTGDWKLTVWALLSLVSQSQARTGSHLTNHSPGWWQLASAGVGLSGSWSQGSQHYQQIIIYKFMQILIF